MKKYMSSILSFLLVVSLGSFACDGGGTDEPESESDGGSAVVKTFAQKAQGTWMSGCVTNFGFIGIAIITFLDDDDFEITYDVFDDGTCSSESELEGPYEGTFSMIAEHTIDGFGDVPEIKFDADDSEFPDYEFIVRIEGSKAHLTDRVTLEDYGDDVPWILFTKQPE